MLVVRYTCSLCVCVCVCVACVCVCDIYQEFLLISYYPDTTISKLAMTPTTAWASGRDLTRTHNVFIIVHTPRAGKHILTWKWRTLKNIRLNKLTANSFNTVQYKRDCSFYKNTFEQTQQYGPTDFRLI